MDDNPYHTQDPPKDPVPWGSLPGWLRILIIIHCFGTVITCIWAGALHDRTWWQHIF